VCLCGVGGRCRGTATRGGEGQGAVGRWEERNVERRKERRGWDVTGTKRRQYLKYLIKYAKKNEAHTTKNKKIKKGK